VDDFPNSLIVRSVTSTGTQTPIMPQREEIAMMFAHNFRIAAAALSLGATAFLAPAEARGFGGFRGGISGFHGGATVRGFGRSRNPVVFMHPRLFRSPFLNGRGLVSREFLFRHRFAADRRFRFRRDRFVARFGFISGYPYSAYDPDYAAYPYEQAQALPLYDSAYATSDYDQSVAQTSPLYGGPSNFSRSSGVHCSLLVKVEKSGDHIINRRIPLC